MEMTPEQKIKQVFYPTLEDTTGEYYDSFTTFYRPEYSCDGQEEYVSNNDTPRHPYGFSIHAAGPYGLRAKCLEEPRSKEITDLAALPDALRDHLAILAENAIEAVELDREVQNHDSQPVGQLPDRSGR